MGAPGGRDRRGRAAFWVYTAQAAVGTGVRGAACCPSGLEPGRRRAALGGASQVALASGQSAKKNEGPQPLARQVQIQCLPLPRLRPHPHRLSSSRRRILPWPSRLHLLRLGCLLRLCLQRGPQPTARWLVQLRGEGHLRPPHGQCRGKFCEQFTPKYLLCLGLALGQELRHRSRRPQPSARQASRAVGSLREPAELLARRPVDPRVADQGVCHQGPRQPTGRSC